MRSNPAGLTPWNETMADGFRRYGSSASGFLPLFAGWKLADQATHDGSRYAWRKLVSDGLIES